MKCKFLGPISREDRDLFCKHCSPQQQTMCSPMLSKFIVGAWLVLCFALLLYLLTDETFLLILVGFVVVLIMVDALIRKFYKGEMR